MGHNEFKKILVPLDGSTCSLKALKKAIYIAQLSGGSITLLYVIPSLPPIPIPDTAMQYKVRMKGEADKIFKDARKIASKHSITLDEKIIFGYPGYDIAYYANRHPFDLIVIGSRGRSAVKELFLGSTSTATMHKSKIPTLVVK